MTEGYRSPDITHARQERPNIEQTTDTEKHQRFLITYGRKTIRLHVDKLSNKQWQAETLINTTSEESQEQETTLAYNAVYNTLVELAKSSQIPITYTYKTANQNMINWAKHTGVQIFNWDNIVETKALTGAPKIVCTTTIS